MHDHFSFDFMLLLVFRDLLAVIATSSRIVIEISFRNEHDVNILHDLLCNKWNFSKICYLSEDPEVIQQILFDQFRIRSLTLSFSQRDYSMFMEPKSDDIFYNNHNGWKGTLIRMVQNEGAATSCFQMKLYHKCVFAFYFNRSKLPEYFFSFQIKTQNS